MDIFNNVRENFSSDNLNFFIIDREKINVSHIVDHENWPSNDELDEANTEFVEVLIIKGPKQRHSYYKGYGDEESLKNYVDMGMSRPFKKMKDILLNSYIGFEGTDL